MKGRESAHMKCQGETQQDQMAKSMKVDGEKYNIIDSIYYVGDKLIIDNT